MAAKKKTTKKPTRTKVKPGALRWAAQLGKREDVEALLAAGADPNEVDGTATALDMACFHRKVPIVRILLQAGASPNGRPDTTSAPLVHAVTSGSKRATEMVRMLLDAGAEPNPPAYRGMTLIEWCRVDPKLADVAAMLEEAVRAR